MSTLFNIYQHATSAAAADASDPSITSGVRIHMPTDITNTVNFKYQRDHHPPYRYRRVDAPPAAPADSNPEQENFIQVVKKKRVRRTAEGDPRPIKRARTDEAVAPVVPKRINGVVTAGVNKTWNGVKDGDLRRGTISGWRRELMDLVRGAGAAGLTGERLKELGRVVCQVASVTTTICEQDLWFSEPEPVPNPILPLAVILTTVADGNVEAHLISERIQVFIKEVKVRLHRRVFEV